MLVSSVTLYVRVRRRKKECAHTHTESERRIYRDKQLQRRGGWKIPLIFQCVATCACAARRTEASHWNEEGGRGEKKSHSTNKEAQRCSEKHTETNKMLTKKFP